MDSNVDGVDEAFEAFERSLRGMSVLEAERERIGKGHAPDEALLKNGEVIEDEILRAWKHESGLQASRRPAVILPFAPTAKPGT